MQVKKAVLSTAIGKINEGLDAAASGGSPGVDALVEKLLNSGTVSAPSKSTPKKRVRSRDARGRARMSAHGPTATAAQPACYCETVCIARCFVCFTVACLACGGCQSKKERAKRAAKKRAQAAAAAAAADGGEGEDLPYVWHHRRALFLLDHSCAPRLWCCFCVVVVLVLLVSATRSLSRNPCVKWLLRCPCYLAKMLHDARFPRSVVVSA